MTNDNPTSETAENAHGSADRWATTEGRRVLLHAGYHLPHFHLADEHWTGSPREMHKRASETMRGFSTVHHPKLGNISFSRQGRDKTLFDKRQPHELQAVQALPEMLQGGEVTASEPDRQGRATVQAVHTIQAGLTIGPVPYRAELKVRQTDHGTAAHKFYLHRIHPTP